MTPLPTTRLFPVLGGDRKYITGIDWEIIAPHERQAMRNHGGQDLKMLASRGGLSLCEMAAVLEDRPWRKMETMDALAAIKDKMLTAAGVVR
jgi:lambda repressor-like predicted transcriptional regulator